MTLDHYRNKTNNCRMLQVGLFHVITDENEIIAVIDATRLRRRKESLQNSGLPGFDPLTSITPLQRSTV